MSVDTNLQRNYVGDGLGDPAITGFGLPRSALTDGSIAGAEVLFKQSLHDIHGLFESKCYLKNPQSAEVLAERQQSALLDSINRVTNGERISAAASAAANTASEMSVTEINDNNRQSPTFSITTMDDESQSKSKRSSPAAQMAEASLRSQRAALREAENFQSLLELQTKEMELSRAERSEEARLNRAERENSAKVLQKVVERLCPEEDPTDKFASRKRKLDELRAVLGEEIYVAKLNQLKEEFLKTAAM
jgi:hypothetical protein